MSLEPQNFQNKSALNPNVVLVCATALILAGLFFFKSGTSQTEVPAASLQTVGQQASVNTLTGQTTPMGRSGQVAKASSSSRSSSFLKRHPHLSTEEFLVIFDIAHPMMDIKEGKVLSLLLQGKKDEAKRLADREELFRGQVATIFGAAGQWDISADLLNRPLESGASHGSIGAHLVNQAVCLLQLNKTEEANKLLIEAHTYAEKADDYFGKLRVLSTFAEAYSEYITLFPEARRSQLLAEAASLYDKVIAEVESPMGGDKIVAIFFKAHKGWVSFLQGKTLEGRQALEQFLADLTALKNTTKDTATLGRLEEASLIHKSRLARIYETLGEEDSAKRLASEVDVSVDKLHRMLERIVL
jgi:hypothetical protein